jgi:hypothetical protein
MNIEYKNKNLIDINKYINRYLDKKPIPANIPNNKHSLSSIFFLL